jgi:hypothetical protein
MTVPSSGLIEQEKDHYRTILVPKHHTEQNGNGWTYTTRETAHPVSGKQTEFIVATSENKAELYTLNKINWKNITIKNTATTPDGKPYRCLFITKENADDAIVLGTSPDLYMLSSFSPLYFIISHLKQSLIKEYGDANEEKQQKRMVTLEDLTDSICDSNAFLRTLESEHGMKLHIWIEQVCEKASVPSMDSDNEDTDEDAFYKPSLNFIVNHIDAIIDNLIKSFGDKKRFEALNMKIDSEYLSKPTEDVQLLIWKKQAIEMMSLFVDRWYIDVWKQQKNVDFSKLDAFLSAQKLQLQAQDTFNETLDQLHEGTMSAQQSKKSKPAVKVKMKSKTAVKLKTGALDMFFKKKET